MSIERIGVVGAGQMGNGIAHVAALSGFGVVLSDVSRELVDKALAVIGKNMDRQGAKGAITADTKAEALARAALSQGRPDATERRVEIVERLAAGIPAAQYKKGGA